MFKNPTPKALSAFALTAILCSMAACANRATVPTMLDREPSAAAVNGLPNASLSGEVLRGQLISVSCSELLNLHTARFMVSGSAHGPFPGTFTAMGGWKWRFHTSSFLWSVDEVVIVSSGSDKTKVFVTGRGTTGAKTDFDCDHFNMIGLSYAKTGYVRRLEIKHYPSTDSFRETFGN